MLSFALGVAYTPWMASFTETVEARNPALTATGLAIWGWIVRVHLRRVPDHPGGDQLGHPAGQLRHHGPAYATQYTSSWPSPPEFVAPARIPPSVVATAQKIPPGVIATAQTDARSWPTRRSSRPSWRSSRPTRRCSPSWPPTRTRPRSRPLIGQAIARPAAARRASRSWRPSRPTRPPSTA